MRIVAEYNSFTISSTVKSTPKISGGLFTSIKEKVLGKNYELSLVFVGTKRARKLNNEHRQKDYATDILSFTLDDDAGEIIINPDKAKKKAKELTNGTRR